MQGVGHCMKRTDVYTGVGGKPPVQSLVCKLQAFAFLLECETSENWCKCYENELRLCANPDASIPSIPSSAKRY